MKELSYNTEQLELIRAQPGCRTFLEGPAGTGKTAAAVERLMKLLTEGISASSALVLVPHRLLAQPYLDQLRSAHAPPGGQVTVLTIGGLARRMIELFWPVLGSEVGFANLERPPTFLTLETAQYFMAQVVRPLLADGYFAAVTIDRNRLYSQILDNLNKAAGVGFSHREIGARLTESSAGGSAMALSFRQTQECASRFRELCYQRNLLDYSLQIEVFQRVLWEEPRCRKYLADQFRVIYADNIEEETPVAHEILRDLAAEADEALLVYDHEGGFRRFLGADPQHALGLKELCNRHVRFGELNVPSIGVQAFAARLKGASETGAEGSTTDEAPALHHAPVRFFPEMLDWTAGSIQQLIDRGVPPSEIVVLAPFMGDALRFALSYRLEIWGIQTYSVRPSRSLLQEPAAMCLLLIAALCHPEWSQLPSVNDLAHALTVAIGDLDPARAQLLAETLYRGGELRPFGGLVPQMKDRITYSMGQRYERLREWIQNYRKGEPQELDHLLSRLFGEILSQVGYGFHANFNAGVAAAQLIRSVREFRQITAASMDVGELAIGPDYYRLAQEGVLGLQSVPVPHDPPKDAVLLAPAYTFLMKNQPVDYQYWLNVGGRGWSDRLYQPLTHPYVMSAQWPRGRRWSDEDEVRVRANIMQVLTQGLLRRCRKGVFLGISELGESGNEERGPLLSAVQELLKESVERDGGRV